MITWIRPHNFEKTSRTSFFGYNNVGKEPNNLNLDRGSP